VQVYLIKPFLKIIIIRSARRALSGISRQICDVCRLKNIKWGLAEIAHRGLYLFYE
tara:strand:- start:444 stop:611 length:168 start_codon:yes stop_codon:yes gene_type:complete